MRDVDVNLSDLESVLEDGTPGADRIWRQHVSMRDDVWSNRAI